MVGIDVEVAVVVAQKASDVVTELANATPTVRTSTVDLMVVVENVEPVLESEPSAKEQVILSHNNVADFVTSTLELKSEKRKPTNS